jgi:hypothetical protein
MDMDYCFLCDKLKPIGKFKKGRNGIRHTTCRDCGAENGKGDFVYLRTWTYDRYKPKEHEIIESLNLLKDMGYDIKGDIHEQFCKKWGLEYGEQKEFLYDKQEILKFIP